jgi:hypothetical protein
MGGLISWKLLWFSDDIVVYALWKSLTLVLLVHEVLSLFKAQLFYLSDSAQHYILEEVLSLKFLFDLTLYFPLLPAMVAEIPF